MTAPAYRVILVGLPDISAELRQDAEIRYADMLEMVAGGEEAVVAACLAHRRMVEKYGAEILPPRSAPEDHAAVSYWWSVDRAAEMAAFVTWKVHPSDVYFDVELYS